MKTEFKKKKFKKSFGICSPGKPRTENDPTSLNLISTVAVLQQHHSISIYTIKIYAALSSLSDPISSHRKVNNNYYYTCKNK